MDIHAQVTGGTTSCTFLYWNMPKDDMHVPSCNPAMLIYLITPTVIAIINTIVNIHRDINVFIPITLAVVVPLFGLCPLAYWWFELRIGDTAEQTERREENDEERVYTERETSEEVGRGESLIRRAHLDDWERMDYANRYGRNKLTNGVTNEAKETWKRYKWADTLSNTNDDKPKFVHYGSTCIIIKEDNDQTTSNLEEGLLTNLTPDAEDQQPCCSICLSDYEAREDVVELPCGHIFHASCINCWTDNHVRCPLCNFNLMEDSTPSMQ